MAVNGGCLVSVRLLDGWWMDIRWIVNDGYLVSRKILDLYKQR